MLSWDEARILQSATVAAELGLPGGDPDMVMRCRDKHLTRKALDACGVPQPRSVLVADLSEAAAAADQMGYPVVLKPRAMGGSLGVVRADSPAELAAKFEFARDCEVPGSWRYDQGVLVEQYVAGPEISVDSAVYHGELMPMFVARKRIGYPPYFEEVGHVVDAADPLLTDPGLASVMRAAHAALGFTDGMTHAEYKLTPDGPQVIEVNARLGGDLIPYLGMRASGLDPGLAAAAVACGQRPQLVADRSAVAGVPLLLRRAGRHRDRGDLVHRSRPPAGNRPGRDAGGTRRRHVAAAQGHDVGPGGLRDRPGRHGDGVRCGPRRRARRPDRSARHSRRQPRITAFGGDYRNEGITARNRR